MDHYLSEKKYEEKLLQGILSADGSKTHADTKTADATAIRECN